MYEYRGRAMGLRSLAKTLRLSAEKQALLRRLPPGETPIKGVYKVDR